MILFGRDFSPFSRMVAIWCDLQGRTLERRQIGTAGPDAHQIKAVNPMGRVPVLVTEDGQALIETLAIVDYLEHRAIPREKLLPEAGAPRLKAMQTLAMGIACADKAVALYSEVRRSEGASDTVVSKLEGQIHAALETLDQTCPSEGFFAGSEAKGPDIGVICAFEFVKIAFPNLVAGRYAALHNLMDRATKSAAFAKTRPEI